MLKSFQDICDFAIIYDSVSVSLPAGPASGTGMANGADYDEARITAIFDPRNGEFMSNYALHRRSGGFVYGGQGGVSHASSAEGSLGPVFAELFGEPLGPYDLNGAIVPDSPSISELVYGGFAWDAFDQGQPVR